MRRLCFDTESSAWNYSIGITDVESSREEMAIQNQRRRIRFDCAVIYDEESQNFLEFTDPEALVGVLATASVLISQNGRRHDLPLLEQICGSERVAALWSITHHDLIDVTGWQGLDALSACYLQAELPGLIEAKEAGEAKASSDHPGRQWGADPNFRPPAYLIACKLAKARFDVERTYRVYRKLDPELWRRTIDA